MRRVHFNDHIKHDGSEICVRIASRMQNSLRCCCASFHASHMSSDLWCLWVSESCVRLAEHFPFCCCASFHDLWNRVVYQMRDVKCRLWAFGEEFATCFDINEQSQQVKRDLRKESLFRVPSVARIRCVGLFNAVRNEEKFIFRKLKGFRSKFAVSSIPLQCHHEALL
jgi:hypothetical protein